MPIATGVEKVLGIKKESTWGRAGGASGAQLLRRVKSDMSLKKDTYESNEIRPDYQVGDFRHGVRSVGGGIDGELSPGTYQLPLAAALRRLFTTVSSQTSLSLTIAASGTVWTVTRGSGSFITGAGFKVGDVIRLSVGALNAANINKNLLILALTATVATVAPVSGVALVAEGPITGCTASIPGRKSWVPTSAHTDESFTLEQWWPGIAQNELFVGCKVQKIDINLPPTGMATIKIEFMGKDMTPGTAAYFTSPTAVTTSGVLAAVNGAVMFNGSQIALLTGLSFSISGGMTSDPVVGANTYPDIFEGRVRVSGQMTVFFQDAAFTNVFAQETEVAIAMAFAAGISGTADFMAFSMPRVKAGG